MLGYTRMSQGIRRRTVRAGLAFLLFFPSITAAAGTLREEAITYRGQGYESQRRGDRATALSYYQKAEALDQAYATPHNDAGILLEEEGRLDEAEREYQQALVLNPDYLEPHANLAMLYERTGRKPQAVEHWLKRYQLGDPYDPWTARAEERLIALGALRKPGMKGRLFSRRRVIGQELGTYAQTLKEFREVTEEHSDWP